MRRLSKEERIMLETVLQFEADLNENLREELKELKEAKGRITDEDLIRIAKKYEIQVVGFMMPGGRLNLPPSEEGE